MSFGRYIPSPEDITRIRKQFPGFDADDIKTFAEEVRSEDELVRRLASEKPTKKQNTRRQPNTRQPDGNRNRKPRSKKVPKEKGEEKPKPQPKQIAPKPEPEPQPQPAAEPVQEQKPVEEPVPEPTPIKEPKVREEVPCKLRLPAEVAAVDCSKVRFGARQQSKPKATPPPPQSIAEEHPEPKPKAKEIPKPRRQQVERAAPRYFLVEPGTGKFIPTKMKLEKPSTKVILFPGITQF